jgi:hypothetical protein
VTQALEIRFYFTKVNDLLAVHLQITELRGEALALLTEPFLILGFPPEALEALAIPDIVPPVEPPESLVVDIHTPLLPDLLTPLLQRESRPFVHVVVAQE